MGKKSLKIKVDGLSDENYIETASQIAKAVKAAAPDSKVSILGADSETFEEKNQKHIKDK